MNLLNYYYYFEKALPDRFCEDLKKHAKNKEEQIAVTSGFLGQERDFKKNPLNKKELNLLKKKRDSRIVWMEDRWIYEEIIPFVKEANKKAGWNFNTDWAETCQFTKYKKNQYYDWHCDSDETPYNQPNNVNIHGKIRKLSVTCSLSDPKEYKGGELEFNFNNPLKKKKENIRKCLEILPKGSLVVFPSHVWHRVLPVTKGTRHSLVIWNLGYPFQ